MKIPAKYRQTGFLDLLCDALYQLRLSCASDDSFIQNRHARSSILASVFAIECCANCLLDGLSGSPDYKLDLERLPTISKYEAYIRTTRPEINLDLGRAEVQKVKELIGLRNEFVHPKISHTDAVMSALKDSAEVVEWPVSLSPKFKQGNQIPNSALFWSALDAEAGVRAALGFLNYYLVDLLSLSKEEVAELICDRIECGIGDTRIVIESLFSEHDSELKIAVAAGFNLNFFGYKK